jgi:multidrug efflux pump subunit AcrA (membrane-fusion protein)
MTRSIWITTAACLVLWSCGKATDDKKAGAAADAGEAAAPVQVALVTRGDIRHVVTADAILYPFNQANVMPKITAPVKRILANRGDHVKAGQLVADLEANDLAAAARESQQQYQQALATYEMTARATVPEDLTKAQADVQAAQQALEAAKKVYENRVALQKEGALAQKLVDDAKVAMVQAQSQFDTASRHLQSVRQVSQQEQIRAAQAARDAAKAHYDSVQAQLIYAEVRSPISGIVSDRAVYPGEIAASGAPLISVVDISQVVARANVPVKDAASIRVGRPAIITTTAGELNGKVTVVSPAVDPSTTTVQVWIAAPNPGERMKPGATVRVSINIENVKNALIVPQAALLSSDEGGDMVLVVQGGVVHQQKVEVGAQDGDKVEITSGVKEGDQVVISGGLGLDDKAKVVVKKPGEEDDKKDDKKDDTKDGKKEDEKGKK